MGTGGRVINSMSPFIQKISTLVACPPTDRALFHAHTAHLVARALLLEQLPPAHLHDEDITYSSFRHEVKTLVLMLLPGKVGHPA